MPPLAGMDFLANWTGKTLGDLYEKTQTTMPATAPGTLTPEQTADIVAFLLSKDNYPTARQRSKGKWSRWRRSRSKNRSSRLGS